MSKPSDDRPRAPNSTLRVCSKIRHETTEAANGHIAELVEKGKADDPKTMHVYFCPPCRSYHVGHVIGTKKFGKKRKRVNPVSDKRRAAMKAAAAERKAEKAAGIVRTCEVMPYLGGVKAWEAFHPAYADRGDLWRTLDRHHVWGSPTTCDEPWNVVTVCRPAHKFEDECWMQAGLLVCAYALWNAGRFEPETVWDRLRVRPVGVIDGWLRHEGLFEDEPVLTRYAEELTAAFPVSGPRNCRLEVDRD